MKNLKRKIIWPVIIVATMGLLSLSLFGYYISKKTIIDHVEIIAEEKVEKLVTYVENKFDDYNKQMAMLASMDSAKNLKYTEFYDYVDSNTKLFKDYDAVFLCNKNGIYIAPDGEIIHLNNEEYFFETLYGEAVLYSTVLSKASGKPSVVISVPIKDNDGKIKGYVGAKVNLSIITKIINEERFGNNGEAFMFDSQGFTVPHPIGHNRLRYFSFDNLKNLFLGDTVDRMVNGEEGTGYYIYNKERTLISFKPVKFTGYSIGISANFNDITKSLDKLQNFFIIISIIIILLIVILLYFLTNNCVQPINKLKDYMEIAIKGDLTVQSDINCNDEIEVLSSSFNTLIRENKKLLEETIQYDHLKTEFFSNVSHELKTPLNIIFSTIQLLSLYSKNNDSDFDAKKLKKHLNIIKQNSYRLLRLVNNLIDITKLDSGFIDLKFQNKNIVQVVENITLSTVEYVESKSRELIFDTEIEEKIMAFDSEQMERIILNLISNAVKFTNPNDKIEVKIYDNKESVLISVKDTGIGIPEEKQKVIFERFRQVDSLYSRRNEGSGIGLSLVKSLVEMHNGNIYVKSECGQGTEFSIELPVKLISEEENILPIEDSTPQSNVEKIHIEFSDIYN